MFGQGRCSRSRSKMMDERKKSSNGTSGRCARNFSQTPSWRTIRSRSVASAVLLLFALDLLAAAKFVAVPTRDRRIEKRFSLTGSPRGIAVASDGTLFVGLADSQSIVHLDPKTSKVISERILDRAEIAATKEIVSLRMGADGKTLVAANGSDESVTILSVPDLAVTREIGLEGETIRDAIPDPAGKYLYVLGRELHIYDAAGSSQIRTIREPAPMAIAVDSTGRHLAVIGSEKFASGDATVVALFDTTNFREIAREPLQTDRAIIAATFAAGDAAIVVVAEDWFAEKSVRSRGTRGLQNEGGKVRVRIDFGDLISSQRICLSPAAGAQILARGFDASSVIFAEKRCAAGESFTASQRLVTPKSIYGVSAAALAIDRAAKLVWVTDPSGFVTAYRAP